MKKNAEDIVKHYLRFYTQYYDGDLDFTGYVLKSLCDDFKISNVSVYELSHTINVLIAALLYEHENRKEL